MSLSAVAGCISQIDRQMSATAAFVPTSGRHCRPRAAALSLHLRRLDTERTARHPGPVHATRTTRFTLVQSSYDTLFLDRSSTAG